MSLDLYDSIVDLFKCCRCNKTIERMLSLCKNGHATCATCSKLELIKCNLCSSQFETNNHVFINSILEATHKREYFLERLTMALECPVCYNNIAESAICRNGHGVCRQCACLTQNCPLCREEYNYRYSFLIESILNQLQHKEYRCSNWTQCQTACIFTKLMDHEVNCVKSFFHCIVESCAWVGALANIGKHMNNSHPALVIEGDSLALQVSCLGEKIVMMQLTSAETFWLVCTRDVFGIKLAVQIHDFHCMHNALITIDAGESELKIMQNILTMNENIIENMNLYHCLFIPNSIAEKFEADPTSKCSIRLVKQKRDQSPKKTRDYQPIVSKVMGMFFVLNLVLFCTKTAK